MYLVNDYFDMPFDKSAGKHKGIHDLSRFQAIGLLLLLIASGFVVTVFLIRDPLYIMLYAFSFFLTTFYSAPPLRFKTRGILGIIDAAIIELTLPSLLVFAAFGHFHFDTFLFTITIFVFQLYGIISHYYEDFEADLKTNVKTFVVKIGREKTQKILATYLQPLMILCFILLYIVTIMNLEVQYSIVALSITVIGYILLKKVKSLQALSYYIYPNWSNENEINTVFTRLCLFTGFPLFLGLIASLSFSPYFLCIILLLMTRLDSYIALFRKIRLHNLNQVSTMIRKNCKDAGNNIKS
jgi:4-hydroxybenzoate polyprenyltransferase